MIHGLALSGGGARGAFEGGSAAAIVEHYQHSEHPITMLSGTSVGALNAAGIAAEGSRYPIEIWWHVSNEEVYHRPNLLMIGWKAWRQSSIFDSSPLRSLIRDALDLDKLAASPLRLFIHATILGTKQSVVFTGKHPDILTGIYASASIPGAFPPVPWNGHWLVDGGTVDNSPIRSLVRAGCEMITVVHLDHEMPAPPILASDVPAGPGAQQPNIQGVLGPAVEAMMDAHFWRDLKNVQLVNQLVAAGASDPHHRQIILQVFGPDRDLGDSLDFDNHRMRVLVDQGYHQALAWLRDL